VESAACASRWRAGLSAGADRAALLSVEAVSGHRARCCEASPDNPDRVPGSSLPRVENPDPCPPRGVAQHGASRSSLCRAAACRAAAHAGREEQAQQGQQGKDAGGAGAAAHERLAASRAPADATPTTARYRGRVGSCSSERRKPKPRSPSRHVHVLDTVLARDGHRNLPVALRFSVSNSLRHPVVRPSLPRGPPSGPPPSTAAATMRAPIALLLRSLSEGASPRWGTAAPHGVRSWVVALPAAGLPSRSATRPASPTPQHRSLSDPATPKHTGDSTHHVRSRSDGPTGKLP
jgi:hypothetical protein